MRIYQNVSPSYCNLLKRIITINPGLTSCPNAVTIANRSGRSIFCGRLAGPVPDCVVNFLPVSSLGPQSEVVMAGVPMGQIVGHHPPRPARPNDLKNAIPNAPSGMRLADGCVRCRAWLAIEFSKYSIQNPLCCLGSWQCLASPRYDQISRN